MSLNNMVLLKGNLTQNPQIKGESENAATIFTLAVAKYNGEADFLRCVCFNKTTRKLGAFIASHAQKGDFVHVAGSISTGSYINNDGQKIYTTDIIVDDFEFLESLAAKEARNRNKYSQCESAENLEPPVHEFQQHQTETHQENAQTSQPQNAAKKPRPQFTTSFSGLNGGTSIPFAR